MPSFWHSLFSIRPSDDAAAVIMMPLPSNFLKFSMNPITVRGLIIPEAADDSGTSLVISKTVTGDATA